MNQEQAKQKIAELIKKYEIVKSSGQDKKYTEEETKKDFILPLFQALGWDVYTKAEVSAEEHIKSSGRVDYGFYINGRTKFYLEAKPLKADLDDEDSAKQAIRYSWNRGVTWAVLTDFESIKVFNAQAISKYLGDKLYFEIPYYEFLERFDQLWQLSKEAFGQDMIDKEAERVGKKLKKVSISSLLYEDLNESRRILTKGFTLWNKKLDKDLLDEGVQRLLDRLVFIRVAEDRGIEPPTLQPLLREWKAGTRKEPFFKSLISKFRELDATYNSNLFKPHPFENWEEYDHVTGDVIDTLYGKPGYYEYDFKAIPADVLGMVYENYLGYRLSQSKKGLAVAKDVKKRKEQGIYYTPSFIVDYIVRNALGPVLDKCNSIGDLKKIKVLDPACGSGSFLIKALEVIADKYKEFNRPIDTYAKIQIITENLYGVDLDEQAVEIARLNLMISALSQRVKFPSLANNIKNGNSLISGTDEELKKYFGKNYRDKKPFNWQEEFPEVFKQGGFDVVIGNPPYLSIERGLLDDIKYFKDNFKTIEKIFDIFGIFMEQSINFLKEDGVLGFIIPNIILSNDSFKTLRKFILDGSKILAIQDYKDGVFNDAVVPTAIIIINKSTNNVENHKIDVNIYSKNELIKSTKIKQTDIHKNNFYRFDINTDENFGILKNKIYNKSRPLKEALKIQEALKTGDDKSFISNSPFVGDNNKVLLKGADIERYAVVNEHFIKYDKTLLKRPGKEEIFNMPEKLYIRRIGNKIISVLDDKQRYAVHTLYTGVLIEKELSIRYILAILNSRLFSYLYKTLFPFKGNIFPEIRIGSLSELPIKIIDNKRQEEFSILVDKIISLKKEIREATENSEKWHKLKSEIAGTDQKIDEEVYKLYGLTKEEIKIVEKH